MALGFFALILFSGMLAAKNIDEEAKKYIMRGESATYFIMNESGQNVYYIVQIDDKNSLVFNEKIEVVLDEAVLADVLKQYYKISGATGFTEASKDELLNKFNESDVLFERCHAQFYDFVEDNFFWAQYRCVDASTGRICDEAFAKRKVWKAAWDDYKLKVQALRTASSRDEISSALEAIETAAKNAKNETIVFDDPGVGYRYFLGNTMDKDPVCLFNYAYLDDVVALSSAAMRNKITDVNSEAKEVVAEYNKRRDVIKIKELQKNGRDVVQKAVDLTLKIDVKFAPLDAKKKEIEDLNEKLTKDESFTEASNDFNALNTKYGELEALVTDPNGLLYAYNRTLHSIDNAKLAIDESIKKYGDKDTRIIPLNNEYVDLVKDVGEINKKLANGTTVTAPELNTISEKADKIALRANGLQAKQNDFGDIWIIAALVVIVAFVIGILIYVIKKRSSGKGGGSAPKEADIRVVMGSGGSKQSYEKEKVDSSQDRKAMFPKL